MMCRVFGFLLLGFGLVCFLSAPENEAGPAGSIVAGFLFAVPGALMLLRGFGVRIKLPSSGKAGKAHPLPTPPPKRRPSNTPPSIPREALSEQQKLVRDAYNAYQVGDMQPLARLVAAAEANKAAQAAAAAKRAKLGHELRLAAISGDDVEAKRLLDAGAPVAALDEIDNCPLSYAATYGHAEVAELLVERGATVKKWHYDKVFPLMDAASGGCSGIIELFINHGADVNETDKEGLTPLHQAAMEGHREAVEVLLKFGADPTRRTKSRREYGQAKMGPGRTPEESARFCGHNQTALFLRHYIEATATAPLKDGNGEDTSQLRRVGHPSIDVVSASGPLRTGDTFALHLGQRRGADITMDFVWVPPGTFVMGSPRDEKGREEYDNEGPQHRVTITQGFWMAACPVTQQQYRLVTGSDPRYTHFGPGLHELPDHPLEHVPWNEASIFCDILNASKRFRGQLRGSEASLPTEAEWEYACRAGTTTPFYSGTTEQELADVGWYVRNSECETHPVGEKTPNAWGLYDMHGNVWEWCHDFYGEYSARNMTDPSGPASDESHVIRGGSYAEGFLQRYNRFPHLSASGQCPASCFPRKRNEAGSTAEHAKVRCA